MSIKPVLSDHLSYVTIYTVPLEGHLRQVLWYVIHALRSKLNNNTNCNKENNTINTKIGPL
jgi:hypothetical protein